MVRLFLALVLAFTVGVGFASNGLEGPCSADECEAGSDDHGATGTEQGSDDCPPLCAGCPRLAVTTTSQVAVVHVVLHAESMVTITPGIPPAAPSLSGLFRPPRA